MKKMVVMAGTNGAGKSSAARFIIPEGVDCFNPDQMIKAFHKKNEAAKNLDAWKHVVKEIKSHINGEKSFAFETTLSDKTVTNKLKTAKQNGFEVNIIYVSLDTVETHYKRVKNRVSNGGHDILKDVITRRFNSRAKYLSEAIAIADKILIINNTVSFQKIAYIEQEKIIYQASNITEQIKKSITEFKLKN